MAYQAPRTWAAGERPTAAQLNQDIRDNENAAFPIGVDGWTTYVPTLTQSGVVTKTVTNAHYIRVGRLVIVTVQLIVTGGAGVGANAVLIGLPVTARGAAGTMIGTGAIYDASANLSYKAIAELNSTSAVRYLPTETTVANHLGATSFTAALANNDVVGGFWVYEAAA